MSVSKWELHRIGLIDFWYYDDEEFYFSDGKLLLRGANGSGKSVTMQSFIPLLLDGNKAPDRLDPFGTKARKIENYLLEENDGREERTGYLYMEFKRKDSDSYLTIGLGLRARRNKKLDSWYFGILDGRRVGKDFYLYKALENKVTLSKIELRNRLEDGGLVMETQKEYMKFVNDRLFGYETMDEYKELIDLLIQLRTPKLSKDFKPTVLNEILSYSLQPLSEDDLRPMSEAIENMDNLKSKLDQLKTSKKAADRIYTAYEHYNKSVLYEKAKDYKSVADIYSGHLKHKKEQEKKLKELSEQLILVVDDTVMLKDEQQTCLKKKADLDKNDVTAIKEKQIELEKQVAEQQSDIKSKETQKDEKESKRVDLEERLKHCGQEITGQQLGIEQKLDELGELVGDISFDEHEFFKAELLEDISKPYDFTSHNAQVFKFTSDVKFGLKLLEDVSIHERDYDRFQEELDRESKIKTDLMRETEQLEAQEIEVKNELKENLYKWNGSNLQLKLDSEKMQRLSEKIENFDKDSDYMAVTSLVWEEKSRLSAVLQEKAIIAANGQKEAEAKVLEKSEELSDWRNKKDPEPERSEAVHINRDALKAAGIPFVPFYCLINFTKNLEPKQADHIEEALLEMGILDALVIPSNYEEKVLSLDAGGCDKYLFSNVDGVIQSISDKLCLDEEVQDLVLYQSIANVLESIGNVKGKGTFIDEGGNFGLGVLQGTITKKYRAKYIGVKARALFKAETIERLEEELAVLEAELAIVAKNFNELNSAKVTLEDEYNSFPKGDDVREAVKLIGEAEAKIKRQSEIMANLESRIKGIFEKIKAVRIEISLVCHKVHLEGKRAVFQEAKDVMEAYSKGIFELAAGQKSLIKAKDMQTLIEGQLEDIDSDIDVLLYDITTGERKVRNYSLEIDNCIKQLELSNYEQIRAELDFCIKRLEELPIAIEEAVAKKATIESNLKQIADSSAQLEEQLEKAVLDKNLFSAGFLDELKLGYVSSVQSLLGNAVVTDDLMESKESDNELNNDLEKININLEKINRDLEKIAEKVMSVLGEYEGQSKYEYLETLQNRFHTNLSEMTEYNLQISTAFSAESYSHYEIGSRKPEFSRQSIFGRYQGKQIGFEKLLLNLVEDIETQERLVSDSDREIFEDILANTISKKIRYKIYKSEDWVRRMNGLMDSMDTSSGLRLNLRWKNKRAEQEEQLDTRELVELLKKDADLLKAEELTKLSEHFHSKVEEARRILSETGNEKSFHAIMREVLDYRKWFEFQLYYRKSGEDKKELTNNAFFTLSGGEKAMSMYVPLFSAVVAKYQGANEDAPKLISLDEAFAGVDEMNIRDMFKLMIQLDFQFIINSQILWGDYDTVPNLAVYQLLRPENAKYVTVIPYLWNGKQKVLMDKMGE